VRNLLVVSAGLRVPSSTRLLADRLRSSTVDAFGDGLAPRVVELREYAHDITNHLLTGFGSPALTEVLDALSAADGLIAVTPVFNASYSGLFKSFFDVVDEQALVDKPALIGATGGTPRHSLALEHAVRPLLAYLRALVVPTAVYASTEDFASGDATAGSLSERVERAGRELATQISRYQRRDPAPPFTPFEDLIR
jgi:FMN reductase